MTRLPQGRLPPEQLKGEALSLFERRAYDEALLKFEAAAAAFADEDNSLGQAEMLNNIGVIHRLRRNWSAAAEALLQAERAFGQAGDESNQAQVLGNLGDLAAAHGEPEQAGRYYSDAAERFAAVGDGERQSQVLRAFSLLQLRRRSWFGAMDLMAKSIRARPHPTLPQRFFSLLLRLALRLTAGR
jgi:tetratricopeptide (TPR) repeat protein